MHISTFFSILTFIFWGIAALIFFYVIPKIERNSKPFDKEKEIEVKVWNDVMGYAIIIGIVCSVFSSTDDD